MALILQCVTMNLHHQSDENSSGTERYEESGDAHEIIVESRQSHEEYLLQKAGMEQRHRNIQKVKWALLQPPIGLSERG